MGITDYLVKKSNGILNLSEENTDKMYVKFDDGGVEVEVGEFLYGLVKILKPANVLSTGIYSGISDMYLAQALKENRLGQITALEIALEHLNRAKKLWEKIEVIDYIDPILISSLQFHPEGKYGLIFLDSEPSIRWQEMVRFYSYLNHGGFIFLHDLPRGFCKNNINPDHPEFKDWPWGEVPNEIKQWVKEGSLREWHFPNPREMCGFYKTRPDDYKWNE